MNEQTKQNTRRILMLSVNVIRCGVCGVCARNVKYKCGTQGQCPPILVLSINSAFLGHGVVFHVSDIGVLALLCFCLFGGMDIGGPSMIKSNLTGFTSYS